MKFVNITDRIVYSSRTGNINPGKKTPDFYHDLEKALQTVIDMCGKKFGVILSENEARLLNKVIDLDEIGSKFDPNTIPLEIRKDPLGIQRVKNAEVKAQHADLNSTAKANADAARREALINGEVEDKPSITPLQVPRNGEDVEQGSGQSRPSGFEAILQENARIAAGKQVSTKDILNPVQALAKEPEAQDQKEAQEQQEAQELPPENSDVASGKKSAKGKGKKSKK